MSQIKVNSVTDTSGGITSLLVGGATSAAGGAQPSRIERATSQASTSGTSINFTSLPSWVKRITVIFQEVSTNGDSNYQIQLGAGSITTTGYLSVSSSSGGGTNITPTAIVTTGMVVRNQTGDNAKLTGHFNFTLISGTTWIHSHTLADVGLERIGVGAGTITLSGTLDRVRITTVNGTDTFDGGAINILYEG